MVHSANIKQVEAVMQRVIVAFDPAFQGKTSLDVEVNPPELRSHVASLAASAVANGKKVEMEITEVGPGNYMVIGLKMPA